MPSSGTTATACRTARELAPPLLWTTPGRYNMEKKTPKDSNETPPCHPHEAQKRTTDH